MRDAASFQHSKTISPQAPYNPPVKQFRSDKADVSTSAIPREFLIRSRFPIDFHEAVLFICKADLFPARQTNTQLPPPLLSRGGKHVSI